MSVKVSLLVTIVVAVFCVGLYAQSPGDVFTVRFSQDVVVGDRILPAGLWDIRWDGTKNSPTLKLYHNNVLNMEVPVVTVPSEDNYKRSISEAVIEKIGSDYYLTNVWVEGERTGHAIRLLPQTAAFHSGEVQRIPAKFASASVFAKGAWIEGQSRSHAAMGLGNPDDKSMTGVVVARAFTPTRPQDDALVQNRPAELAAVSDDRELSAIPLGEPLGEKPSDIPSAHAAITPPKESRMTSEEQEGILTARNERQEGILTVRNNEPEPL